VEPPKESKFDKQKNPEWKVLITEHGFIRNIVPFLHQVNDIIMLLHKDSEIPPVGRNDECI
jgi:hypothetical protein